MKLIVLNGSPKGLVSVTMQYIRYIQQKFPQHELEIISVVKDITRLEKDEAAFASILDKIKAADGVIWAFPLYYMLVHSGYKRFIELVFERKKTDFFRNKYAVSLSTSIHFYDHTAHNYIQAICDDLDMKFLGFFSPGMEDLFKEKERMNLEAFFSSAFHSIETHTETQKAYYPLQWNIPDYQAGAVTSKIDSGEKKVLIITDYTEADANLKNMTERFRNNFTGPVEIVNIHEISIKGGCLGCLRCGFDNECAYGKTDDIYRVYTESYLNADIILFALKMKDRYLSSRWKEFLDRRFFRTHQPLTAGKQAGFILSGPLSQNLNLREILQGGRQSPDQTLLVGLAQQ